MFEIINSQQEALHHHYEMYSLVPKTIACWEIAFLRGVEDEQERLKNALYKFTENKSITQYRYAIYQLHHLKNQTKIKQLWIGQTIVSQRQSVIQ